jgi:hypothetical protein
VDVGRVLKDKVKACRVGRAIADDFMRDVRSEAPILIDEDGLPRELHRLDELTLGHFQRVIGAG